MKEKQVLLKDGTPVPYIVREDGVIISLHTGKIMPGTKNHNGRLVVTLRNKSRNIKEVDYIHRIVARMFINPNLTDAVVNHKDGDLTNNAVSNLEVTTPADSAKSNSIVDELAILSDHFKEGKLSPKQIADLYKIHESFIRHFYHKLLPVEKARGVDLTPYGIKFNLISRFDPVEIRKRFNGGATIKTVSKWLMSEYNITKQYATFIASDYYYNWRKTVQGKRDDDFSKADMILYIDDLIVQFKDIEIILDLYTARYPDIGRKTARNYIIKQINKMKMEMI